MAQQTITIKDGNGSSVSIPLTPTVGAATAANSLPTTTATDDPVVLQIGALGSASYTDASGAAAGSVVGLLKGLFVKLASLLKVDTVVQSVAADRSGTITTANTAQQLMAANASRRGFAIQNQSAGDLFLSGSATAVLGQPSLKVPAGAFYETSITHTGVGAVSVIGATAGQAFYAREW